MFNTMRLKFYTVCLLVVTLQKAVSVSVEEPQTGTALTAGISFEVSWGWDGLPNPSDDGTMDILLVNDISASTVVAQLDSNVSPLRLYTSATVPLNVTSGMYYLQLKVTSGPEKSAVNGPFNVVNGSSSNSSSVTSSSSSNSSSVTSSSPSISSHTPNASSTTSTTGSNHSGVSEDASFIGPIVGGCVVWLIIFIAIFYYCRKRIRMFNAMTAKNEKEAKLYEQQMQINNLILNNINPSSPTRVTDMGNPNAPSQNAGVLSTEQYNYVVAHDYTNDERSQPSLRSQSAGPPPAYGQNNTALYPMPMPAPFDRQQGTNYQQQLPHVGYGHSAESQHMANSSSTEGSNITSVPNFNNSSSPLNIEATQDSTRNVLQHPEEILNSQARLNNASQPPHSP